MLVIEQLAQMVQDLGDDEQCPICLGAGLIPCTDHGVVLDADGWCAICEAPMDGGPAHSISCPCQPA